MLMHQQVLAQIKKADNVEFWISHIKNVPLSHFFFMQILLNTLQGQLIKKVLGY